MEKEYKKILLTGDIQIGKSTIINNYIYHLNKNNIKFNGYRTITKDENGDKKVYILPFNSDKIFTKENLICEKNTLKFYPEVFDNYGLKMLEKECKLNNLLIFDEIGYIENKSKIYKYKLLEILKNDNYKIIGTLRKLNTELYKEILNIKDIKFIEVTKNNRSNIKIENIT